MPNHADQLRKNLIDLLDLTEEMSPKRIKSLLNRPIQDFSVHTQVTLFSKLIGPIPEASFLDTSLLVRPNFISEMRPIDIQGVTLQKVQLDFVQHNFRMTLYARDTVFLQRYIDEVQVVSHQGKFINPFDSTADIPDSNPVINPDPRFDASFLNTPLKNFVSSVQLTDSLIRSRVQALTPSPKKVGSPRMQVFALSPNNDDIRLDESVEIACEIEPINLSDESFIYLIDPPISANKTHYYVPKYHVKSATATLDLVKVSGGSTPDMRLHFSEGIGNPQIMPAKLGDPKKDPVTASSITSPIIKASVSVTSQVNGSYELYGSWTLQQPIRENPNRWVRQ